MEYERKTDSTKTKMALFAGGSYTFTEGYVHELNNMLVLSRVGDIDLKEKRCKILLYAIGKLSKWKCLHDKLKWQLVNQCRDLLPSEAEVLYAFTDTTQITDKQ